MFSHLAVTPSQSKKKTFILLLAVVCALQIAAVIYYAWFLDNKGYLPAPFIYSKADTFMDLFNPMYWADQEDRYTEWASVYPPLNFLFLKLLRGGLIGPLDFSGSLEIRKEGLAVIAFFIASYFSIPAFILKLKYWKDFGVAEKILIYLIAITSGPMLFTLERGNLIIYALPLLTGLLICTPRARIFVVAVLINLKPYFALLFFGNIVKRRWNELILSVAAAGGLYLLTGILLDSNPFLLPLNLLGFSQQGDVFTIREVLAMPSSVTAFSYAVGLESFQRSMHSDLAIDFTVFGAAIEVAKWAVLLAAATTLCRLGKDLPWQQAIAMILVITTNSGISVGGYTVIFYFVLIPVFFGMRWGGTYLSIIALMSLPLDIIPMVEETIPPQPLPAYFTGYSGSIDWTLGAGSFVRPILNLLLLAIMVREFTVASRCRLAILENRGGTGSLQIKS